MLMLVRAPAHAAARDRGVALHPCRCVAVAEPCALGSAAARGRFD
jgi:hypothetical protein